MNYSVIVRKIWDKVPEEYSSVNCTSRSTEYWSKQLSPFIVGPVSIDGETALNVENGWQYSKVYPCHVDENNEIKLEYFEWRQKGFQTKQGIRYPMGKGVKPLFSYVDGKRHGYFEAKKNIYVPLYSNAVLQTGAFENLVSFVEKKKKVCILDFDAYDHTGMTKEEIITNPSKIFGHGFCLMWLLQEVFEIVE
jgi:hypothetical protein